jgi:hypothetical protein
MATPLMLRLPEPSWRHTLAPNPYKRTGKRKSPTGVPRRMDEHRWLMEQHLGRRLDRFELVHHKNGDKRDNRMQNLEVVTPAEHAARHGMWKHPATKRCLICEREFTPAPTKRARAKTCSRPCRLELMSQLNRDPTAPRSIYRQGAYPSEIAARKSPQRSSKRTST